MSYADVVYKQIIEDILAEGVWDKGGEVRPIYANGEPAHSKSIFGVQTTFHPGDIPIVTSKKVPVQSSINEVVHAFFRLNTTNVSDFEDLGIGYWREWTMPNGTIGKSYGYQLAEQKQMTIKGMKNQVDFILHMLKEDPFSRRIMFSYWNANDANYKALQECAYTGQFNVRPNNRGELVLDFLLIQRSVDVLLGLPTNWAGYYALQCALASLNGFKVGKFVHQMGNVHLYDNQIEKAKELLTMKEYEQPEIYVNPDVKDFYDFTVEDIKYINYKHGRSVNAGRAI